MQPSVPPESPVTVQRPASILVAAVLLYASLALRIGVDLAGALQELQRIPSPVLPFIGSLFFQAILCWIIVQMYGGKNWARFTLLVIYALGSLQMVLLLLQTVRFGGGFSFYGVFRIADCVPPVVALVLLFGRDANRWYRERKSMPGEAPPDAGMVLSLSLRIGITLAIVAAAFITGSLVYYSISGHGKGAQEYYPAAVMMFPIGFAGLLPGQTASGQGHTLLFFGWSFYGLCLLVLLIQKRPKLFFSTCFVLVVAIILNLQGCSHLMRR